ncbi:thiamine pyrophosphate-binding protein [Acidianus sulfidivorans JP7]|uniref:2-oxoacid oxidoreductase (ferredoxin) n=1 Tax=Acidianus sulfidivorans JP7 TaxID=619593 RepID=A0A2U9IMX8_9CREN|nr:thiamine pyrophosphate-binding protein [Acidianus sulfidivorans]AWR97357.1 thiamine pyrophosphate-binding protein [Acidianus sulfidivorans JP7]
MSQPKRKEETVGKEMDGIEALAYVLKEIGTKKIFSSITLPENVKERLKQYEIEQDISVNTRDSVMLAETYAIENNTAGVVIAIPGTQILEALDIISQAYMDSVPLLIISSLRSYRDTGRARVGELRTPDDLSTTLSQITKLREKVVSIEEITVTVEKANKEALSNRPRPTLVEIAEDLFKLKAYPLSPAEQKPEKRTPDKNTVAKVAEVLSNSKLPVIVAGYGVLLSNSYTDLLELAELLDIPVITTIKGKGSFPASNPLFAGEGLGLIGTEIGNKILSEADSILLLGTRLTQLSTGGWSMKYKGFVMHNNIDGEDIGKVLMPHLPIVADTGLFLKELITIIKQKIKEKIDRGIQTEIKINKKPIVLKGHVDIWPYDIVRLLQQFTFSKIFVDLSAVTFDMIRYPIDTPTWFTSESILAKGLGIAGVIESSDPNALGITDIYSVSKNLSLLYSRHKTAKGTIIIFNDDGSTYLDTTKADVPTIGNSKFTLNIDKELDSIGAYTIYSYSDLKSAINEKKDGLKILNVKIDPEYESAVLARF